MNSGRNRTATSSESTPMKHRLVAVHRRDITKFLDEVDRIGGIVVAITPPMYPIGSWHLHVIYKAPINSPSPMLDSDGTLLTQQTT